MLLVVLLARARRARRRARRTRTNVSYEEAEAIAREQIDFEPDKVLVRGVQQRTGRAAVWAVSLSTQNAAGVTVECATVLVDAETGEAQTEPC